MRLVGGGDGGGTGLLSGRRLVTTARSDRDWFGTTRRLWFLCATAAVPLGEAFNPQLLGHGKEGVEIVLGNVDLSMIHEAQHALQLLELDPLQVQEWVLVTVPPQHLSEEGAAGRDDHLVCLDLRVIFACKCHVEELLVVANFTKS